MNPYYHSKQNINSTIPHYNHQHIAAAGTQGHYTIVGLNEHIITANPESYIKVYWTQIVYLDFESCMLPMCIISIQYLHNCLVLKLHIVHLVYENTTVE